MRNALCDAEPRSATRIAGTWMCIFPPPSCRFPHHAEPLVGRQRAGDPGSLGRITRLSVRAQALSALARQLTPQADERGFDFPAGPTALVLTIAASLVAAPAALAQTVTGGTDPSSTTPVPTATPVAPVAPVADGRRHPRPAQPGDHAAHPRADRDHPADRLRRRARLGAPRRSSRRSPPPTRSSASRTSTAAGTAKLRATAATTARAPSPTRSTALACCRARWTPRQLHEVGRQGPRNQWITVYTNPGPRLTPSSPVCGWTRAPRIPPVASGPRWRPAAQHKKAMAARHPVGCASGPSRGLKGRRPLGRTSAHTRSVRRPDWPGGKRPFLHGRQRQDLPKLLDHGRGPC